MTSLAFSYTPDQWLRVRRELPPAVQHSKLKTDLEKISDYFLQMPLASDMRTWSRSKRQKNKEIAEAAMALLAVLSRNAKMLVDIYNAQDAYRIRLTSPYPAIPRPLEEISGELCEQLQSIVQFHGWVASQINTPHAREDFRRQYYLKRLCDYWSSDLGRPLTTSVTNNRAGGPAVRFLTAASSPAFQISGEKELSPGAARAVLRKYRDDWREGLRRHLAAGAPLSPKSSTW